MVDLTCTRKYGFDKLKINAPILLLSNVRPIIALMTSQLGFKPFYIPFMNFTDSDDEVQEGVAKRLN